MYRKIFKLSAQLSASKQIYTLFRIKNLPVGQYQLIKEHWRLSQALFCTGWKSGCIGTYAEILSGLSVLEGSELAIRGQILQKGNSEQWLKLYIFSILNRVFS